MYYMGDYYMGDYYRGDPFLGLGKLWKGIKKVGKFALGAGGAGASKQDVSEAVTAALAQRPMMAGIPSPGVAGGALLGAGGAAMLARQGGRIGISQMAIQGGAGQEGFDIPGPMGVIRPRRILPGGVPFYSPEQCPTGYHMDKTTGTYCVRNRRMNVANPRALRRGLRRVAGFGKLAQRARRDIGRAATAVGAGGRSRRCAPVRRRKCA